MINFKNLFKKKEKKENGLPESLKRHNIRVSNPYGAYPEDVDKLILELENTIALLEKDNKSLSAENDRVKKDVRDIEKQYKDLVMQVQLMEIPDTSTEEDSVMMSKMQNIMGNRLDVKNEETEQMIEVAAQQAPTVSKEKELDLDNDTLDILGF